MGLVERRYADEIVKRNLPLGYIDLGEGKPLLFRESLLQSNEYADRLSIMEESLAHGERVSEVLDYYQDSYKEDDLDLPNIHDVRSVYRLGAILHDAGKAYSTENPFIYHKRKKDLTPDEQRQIDNHVFVSPWIFEKIESSGRTPLPDMVRDMALLHHEKVDGTGYAKIPGEKIPRYIRLLTIADELVARLENRPYRNSDEVFTLTSALEDMEFEVGSKFDPDLFVDFKALFHNDIYMRRKPLAWMGKNLCHTYESNYPVDPVRYYQHGEDPKILIIGGFHGDESEIDDVISRVLSENLHHMPDFLYIPVASPKAYRRGKRNALQEGDEYDLNRSFLPNTQVWEAKALMEFLQRYRFKLCLTIHEDDNHNGVYFYDTEDIEGSEFLGDLRRALEDTGVSLHDGIDDKTDDKLGYMIQKGFCFQLIKPEEKKGFFEEWTVSQGIVERSVNPEIPPSATYEQKTALIKIFLDKFLI